MSTRKILITSALPYVNNVPHLGNIIGCVLSADVFSRYCTLRGYEKTYVCGTDEYGAAIEIRAMEEGVSCQAICDRFHAPHKRIYDWFHIAFDVFGRTTSNTHKAITTQFFQALQAKNLLSEEKSIQFYDPQQGRFLADRFLVGTCPHCGYAQASGDQCDQCGRLLSPEELLHIQSKLSGATPVPKESVPGCLKTLKNQKTQMIILSNHL